MKSIAAVIVTYNSEEVIGSCLDACLKMGLGEIIVADNASTDDTRAEVRRRPGVRLIENAGNRGFAAAVNQGIAASHSALALLLNPDTRLVTPIDDLALACQQPGVGAAAGMLVAADGAPQAGFNVRRLPTPAALSLEVMGINRLWPSNPVNRGYRCHDLDAHAQASVEQPAGAFLMVRRDAWTALGGLDESFAPIWFEDVDFCKRMLDSGRSIRYLPSARAIHVGGHSIQKITFECREVCWYASLLGYASKHFTRLQNIGVSVSVVLSSVPRVMAGICRERSFQPVVVFGKVIRRAAVNMVRARNGEAVTSPIELVKIRRGARVVQNLNS